MAAHIFCPNDWKVKNSTLFALIVTVIFTMLVIFGLAGIDVPGVRQVIAFVFLTFIPGMLILRILRIHNINPVESIVYSAGLSLAFVMVCGIAINFALPLVNISQPIRIIPVTVMLALFSIVLMIAAYARDGHYEPASRIQTFEFNLNSILFLLFILSLAILGVAINNATNNNIILLICIPMIGLIIALAAFGKFILPPVFPAAIFIISLCLLYQTTLLSPYLVGTDIYAEYQVFQQVARDGIWNYAVPNPINSCLSIALLGPIYSQSLNLDGIWIFKAVYPLVFSLVPLVLFRIFRIQFGMYRALFATFLFMAVPTFSLEMISLCRQQVAELFFVLTVLLLAERKLNPVPKIILLTIFIVSIAVSHYSLGIISLIYVAALIPLVIILRNSLFIRAWGWLTGKAGGLPPQFYQKAGGALPLRIILIPAAFFTVFVFVGYTVMSSGVNLELLASVWAKYTAQLGNQVAGLLSSPLSTALLLRARPMDGLIQAALGLDFLSVSWQGQVFRILQYITQVFIVIGCLRLIFRPRGLNIKPEYVALIITSVLLLLACVVIAGFADRLNTTRWYHLALIMLAPFCILGGEAVWRAITSLAFRLRYSSPVQNESGDSPPGYAIALSLAVLIPYFLVSSGFLYEVTGQSVTDKVDTPYSIALSSYRVDFIGIFNKKDGAAALWLTDKSSNESIAYTDDHAHKILRLNTFPGQIKILDDETCDSGCYLFFTGWNNSREELTFNIGSGLRRIVNIKQDQQLGSVLDSSNTIYVNGDPKVLLTR